MVAEVIPLEARRHRVSADRIELAFRRSEERAAHVAVMPLLRRLELLAHEHGPAAHQLVAAVEYWHQRHDRRWTEVEPEPAA